MVKPLKDGKHIIIGETNLFFVDLTTPGIDLIKPPLGVRRNFGLKNIDADDAYISKDE